ncbi:MAG: hypothetical protein LC793_15385 [Thermomicrobia bacterium]|nr:hypothetical protein [Thermomicrobia bacterium]
MTGAMQPNIVLVITHDTGTHLGCYRAGMATPQLDGLTTRGCSLTVPTAPRRSVHRAAPA